MAQNLPLPGGRWGERGRGQLCDKRRLLRQWRRAAGRTGAREAFGPGQLRWQS